MLGTILTLAGGIALGTVITLGILAPGRSDLRMELAATRQRAHAAESALMDRQKAEARPGRLAAAVARAGIPPLSPIRIPTPPPPPSAPIASTTTMRKVVPSQRRTSEPATTVFPSVAAASWAPPSTPAPSCDTSSSSSSFGGDCGVSS